MVYGVYGGWGGIEGRSGRRPHFHVRYGKFEATIEIATLNILEGTLLARALSLVQEWAMMHREELQAHWRLCRENAPPERIEPLS